MGILFNGNKLLAALARSISASIPVILMFHLSLFSACFCLKNSASPGRIPADSSSIALHREKFTTLSQGIDCLPELQYEVIGHALSSWRYYPMGVNRHGTVYGNGVKGKYNRTPADSILNLIDKSIQYDPTMSLEMDVQYIPEKAKVDPSLDRSKGYIMHNIPHWNQRGIRQPSATRYLKTNTLQTAIDRIVQMKYYERCNVYLEIKARRKSYHKGHEHMNDSQCYKLAAELTGYLRLYHRTNQQNWLCVYSFSPQALTRFRSYMPDDVVNKVDYILVAGYVPLYRSFYDISNLFSYISHKNYSP